MTRPVSLRGASAEDKEADVSHVSDSTSEQHVLNTRKTTRHQVVLEVARAGIEPATFRFSGGRDSH